MNVIFLRAVRPLLDPTGEGVQRKPFDVEFCTLSGTIVRGNVVCTSSNFANNTFNFRFVESGEFRTVHASLLLSINKKEIML